MALRAAITPSWITEATLNPSSINAGSVSSETFSVSGLETDMAVVVNAPNLEAGVFLLGAFVSARNVLTLVLWNTTVAPVNPASQAFKVIAF